MIPRIKTPSKSAAPHSRRPSGWVAFSVFMFVIGCRAAVGEFGRYATSVIAARRRYISVVSSLVNAAPSAMCTAFVFPQRCRRKNARRCSRSYSPRNEIKLSIQSKGMLPPNQQPTLDAGRSCWLHSEIHWVAPVRLNGRWLSLQMAGLSSAAEHFPRFNDLRRLFQNLVAADVSTRQFQMFAPTDVGGYGVLQEPLTI